MSCPLLMLLLLRAARCRHPLRLTFGREPVKALPPFDPVVRPIRTSEIFTARKSGDGSNIYPAFRPLPALINNLPC
jgi:hypothetical protein